MENLRIETKKTQLWKTIKMESIKKVIFDTICDKMESNPGFLRRDHRNVRRVRLATDAQEQVMRLQINLNTTLYRHFFMAIEQ